MLCVTEAKSNRIRKVWRQEDRLYLCSDAGTHRLEPRDSATVRVTYTLEEEFGEEISRGSCTERYSPTGITRKPRRRSACRWNIWK